MKINLQKIISIFMILACMFTVLPQLTAEAASSSDFELYTIDVEGSATLIDFHGSYILVDGGKDAAKVVNYLQKNCKKKNGKVVLAAVVLTHNHVDHINGILQILNSPDKFKVENFYMENLFEANSSHKGKLNDAIKKHRKTYHQYPAVTKLEPGDPACGLGMINNISSLTLTVYPPVKNYLKTDTVHDEGFKLNECSMVVKVDSSQKNALMMGDCYDMGFVDLCRKYGTSEFQSDICVMAHHGLRSYNVADKTRYSIGNKQYSEIDIYNKYIDASYYILPTTKELMHKKDKYLTNIKRYKTKLKKNDDDTSVVQVVFPWRAYMYDEVYSIKK